MEIMSDKADKTDKAALRATLLAARAALPVEMRDAANAAIAKHVLAWWHAQPLASLGVYWPMRNEPDLQAVYATLAGLGVQLALPVVQGPALPLRFAPWLPGEALQKDAMGVFVPARQTAFVQPAGLLIPCVGFTAQGMRLGYGGGFYDRTLAVRAPPQTVGIAYAAAQVRFAAGPFDVALGRIITELG